MQRTRFTSQQRRLVKAVAYQHHRQQSARDAGQASGQPLVLPGVAQAFAEMRQQAAGMFAVLAGGGVLRGGKENPHPRPLSQGERGGRIDKHGRIQFNLVAAVGTGEGVQRLGAEAVGQVGACGEVNDEVDFGIENALA
ncbi:MAG: hypothetical protein WHX52_23040 [Anaerolineae bacterium]